MLESSAPAFHDCTDHVPHYPLLKAVDARLVCLAITWVRCDDQLRGAASHEAEGRRGARGGEADRVGPPAGRRRRSLLCEIGNELVAGLEQFLLGDDVVAVEDGSALVPGQEHGDPLGDAGAD